VLGGNLALVFSGSAPISAEVMDFLKIAFCCDVIEGEITLYPVLGSMTLNFRLLQGEHYHGDAVW
jgi:long-chain acyl-CoA synthetase